MRVSWFTASCLLVVVCSLVLGGGTHSGFVGDFVVQLTAIPLLVWAIGKFIAARPPSAPWFDLAVCVAIVLVPAMQLVPIPSALWMHLPGHDLRAAAFELADRPVGAVPLSLDADQTALAALSLISPLAVFLAVRMLDAVRRRVVVLGFVTVAVVSVFVGFLQVAGGHDSPFRFFAFTNVEGALGFFANRNHFAAFLYVAIMLVAAWLVESALVLAERDQRRKQGQTPLISFALSLALLFLFGVAQLLAQSRAGVGLTVVASISIALLFLFDRRNRWRRLSLRIVGGVAVVAIIVSIQIGFSGFYGRLRIDPLTDTRVVVAEHTLKAARDYFPFGSGINTFRPVYAMYERVDELIFKTFMNAAHNDLVQLWLEAGIPGVTVLAIFFAWLIFRGTGIWTRGGGTGQSLDNVLQRTAFVAIILLLAHSLVDYPLRTAADTTLFALCCALVTPAAASQRRLSSSGDTAYLTSTSKSGRRRSRGDGLRTNAVPLENRILGLLQPK